MSKGNTTILPSHILPFRHAHYSYLVVVVIVAAVADVSIIWGITEQKVTGVIGDYWKQFPCTHSVAVKYYPRGPIP